MTPNLKQAHKRRGTTLIELTVVIVMILALISALFFSANFYRNASNKAACIIKLSSFQKAIQGYQNINGLKVGAPVARTDFYGPGNPFPTESFCPSRNGDYILLGEIPTATQSFAVCKEFNGTSGSIDATQDHSLTNLTN